MTNPMMRPTMMPTMAASGMAVAAWPKDTPPTKTTASRPKVANVSDEWKK